ncbi:MAG: DUF1109 domain-containing protein, partial [Caulobacteraceae bacterium]|nr:DUF1109 domain-containing protein [Caulobacter sp.]
MTIARDPSLDALVADLSADLRPVRRLPPPPLRAAAWIGLALAMGGGLALSCDLPALWSRLAAAPDMWLAAAASVATAAS